MILPQDLQQKINELFVSLGKKKLMSTRENLTDKYKNQTGTGKSHIDGLDDSLTYAISRMPATYAVAKTLVSELVDEKLVGGVNSIIDIGSGTGSGYFALKEIFEDAEISLFEREQNMIDVFHKLSNHDVTKLDITKEKISSKADLVTASYVLSEMNENDRIQTVKKMLELSNKYVLLIDTGTPRTYENFMKIKKMVLDAGFFITAPCSSEKCGLKNDYCQFYARIERSSLERISKSATQSYEDEKYFYLLIGKQQNEKPCERVIRRPAFKTNVIELMTCSSNGVEVKKITKKDKDLFKLAKKVKVNQILNNED